MFGKIERFDLFGTGGPLEEVCHWRWVLRFQILQQVCFRLPAACESEWFSVTIPVPCLAASRHDDYVLTP